jgi:hypothetical protein
MPPSKTETALGVGWIVLGIVLLPTLPIWIAICTIGWAVSMLAVTLGFGAVAGVKAVSSSRPHDLASPASPSVVAPAPKPARLPPPSPPARVEVVREWDTLTEVAAAFIIVCSCLGVLGLIVIGLFLLL